jgi:hypothetical protein
MELATQTMRIQLTRESAYAAAQDAANRNMRKAGRKRWNQADWNAACRVFDRLYPPSVMVADTPDRQQNSQTLTEKG